MFAFYFQIDKLAAGEYYYYYYYEFVISVYEREALTYYYYYLHMPFSLKKIGFAMELNAIIIIFLDFGIDNF